MDRDYVIFFGAVIAGVISAMLTMYLIYRRGIAIRLTAIMSACCIIVAIPVFILGKTGITITTAAIVLAIIIPLICALLMVLVKQIVTPTIQITDMARTVSRGELNQTPIKNAVDEMRLLADALQDTTGYVEQVATIAGCLAQGDLTATWLPNLKRTCWDTP